MSATFTEATRVQIPAMVHLSRLGYSYFGKISEGDAGTIYDPDTNILLEEFRQQFSKLNPERGDEWKQVIQNIKKELNDDDLGRGFYERLISLSPYKLIDFEHPENNSFAFTAEFTCKNGEDEFRPDITLFVNGLPLCFVEVKKPNNHGGMTAESTRMNEERFPNKKFRRFINITQLMIFSNNMEYDALGGIVPVQGAFYCTGGRNRVPFNCFREDNPNFLRDYPYRPLDSNVEREILRDFNCQVIHTNPEYQNNLNILTPTNRILTSMCSPTRLLFILKYGIAYVKMEKEVDGKIESLDQKHIMRYQQMFASLAIRNKLANGVQSGVVWHTQGSGKTALSYYLVKVLSDHYAKLNKVAKFYFIVDRLDLLEQASQEFESRGLVVKTANSKKELMDQFRNNQALEGVSGRAEITVVNIQRFAEDKEKVQLTDYATNLQRVFILDEAHRGYKPGGCFLANLFEADPSSVKIALTGTPLLKEERASCKVFGDYLHTYYYDKSVADGYTLKIIREEIETSYKEKLSEIYNSLNTLVQKRELKKSDIIEHDNYVCELGRYISTDLKKFRDIQGDQTLGGMVICETSMQAKKLYEFFNEEWEKSQPKTVKLKLPDGTEVSGLQLNESSKAPLKAGLILHDSDDKETRRQLIKDFKKNLTVDVLIVFNMLLTGFDAPRLKRLYLGRKLKDHNLLQAITRVNRPYKEMHYGFLIDFADIKKNFEETNEAYLKELSRFNIEDGTESLRGESNNVIVSKDEVVEKLKKVRQALFSYSSDNLETFSTEISQITEKKELIELRHTLEDAKNIANLVRTFGDEETKKGFAKLEITQLPRLLSEVNNRISIINQEEAFKRSEETKIRINEAMAGIEFNFSLISSDELKMISGGIELKEKWKQTISQFTNNLDPEDPEYISLREAFLQRFREKGFVVDTLAKFDEETKALDDLLKRLKEIQRRDKALISKYQGDVKFARVHKRIREENSKRKEKGKEPILSFFEEDIRDALVCLKENIDSEVYDRNDILKKDAYFKRTVMHLISNTLKDFEEITPQMGDFTFLQSKITQQYLNQYNSIYPS